MLLVMKRRLDFGMKFGWGLPFEHQIQQDI
jgi:hypothetical protein